MRKCQNCNHENPDNAVFCENCGIKFIDNLKKCPQCQTVNTSESRFCENCGYDFQSATPEDTGSEEQLQQSNRSNAVHDLAEQQVPTSAADVTSTIANGSDNAIFSAQERPQVQHAIDGKEKSQSGSEPESSQGKLSSASDRASMMTGGTPDKQRVSRLPKWVRLVSGLVIILLIGVGAYFVYGHPSASSKAPSTPAVTNKERSNVATKESGTSSSGEKRKSVNFNVTEIKKDIGATVGAIGGTNSVYVSPVNSEQSVVVNNGSQRSASSIKIYIMVTAYAMAKEGVFNLNDTHTLTNDEKVGGTGVIQNMRVGTELSYREIIEYMIDDSDNTGANIMIDKLGGFQLINNKIKSMGATDTKLRRKMLDTKALDNGRDNTTSARDMGTTLKMIYNHHLVSREADDEMLAILRKNQNRTKLPNQLPSTATVYNKTGEYADYGVQNDAEIVRNSQGAFVAVVLSEDGEETDQLAAMNKLGLMLYQNILA
ncbi:hypothetical protein CT113_04270 [Levilactobacillus brevis]|uniref:serine hydrolase n=1 Tax=Levilactobacillus brevis TaxID=1580 RepID=UPI00046345D7|nr:serine hydrolase [Levilactobacillus brevis]ATU69582.1 hypothetical protein CT113_04270 [Levilactobacillus brevis]